MNAMLSGQGINTAKCSEQLGLSINDSGQNAAAFLGPLKLLVGIRLHFKFKMGYQNPCQHVFLHHYLLFHFLCIPTSRSDVAKWDQHSYE